MSIRLVKILDLAPPFDNGVGVAPVVVSRGGDDGLLVMCMRRTKRKPKICREVKAPKLPPIPVLMELLS